MITNKEELEKQLEAQKKLIRSWKLVARKYRDKPELNIVIQKRLLGETLTMDQVSEAAAQVSIDFCRTLTNNEIEAFFGHIGCIETGLTDMSDLLNIKAASKIEAQVVKAQEKAEKKKEKADREAKKVESEKIRRQAIQRKQMDANAKHRGKTIFAVRGDEVNCITEIIPKIGDWLKYNKSVYMAGGLLARWSESRDDIVIFNRDNFGPELAKGFAFCSQKMTWDKEDERFVPVQEFLSVAPSHIVDAILGTEYFHDINELDAVLKHPTIDTDGTVQGTTPGYNPDNKIMYAHSIQLETVDLDKAYRDLYEPFSEFPQCAIPGALATLFTLVTRAHMPTAPMICFDAPAEGSGKSLLARVCQELVLGTKPNARSQEASDEEFDKNLKSFMQNNPGKPLFLDDFEGMIKYPVLKTLLTQPGHYSFRVLGTAKDCRVRTNFPIILTGNHIELSVDLNRRSIIVNLNTESEAPANKGGYKRNESELEQYVIDNRDHLMSCLLTILQDAISSAGPEHNTRAMGSFEEWATVVGRSVKYACAKLMSLGLLDGEIPTDVTPDFKNFIKMNDGITEVFNNIYEIHKDQVWTMKMLSDSHLSLLDSALGLEGYNPNNVKRGKRLKLYTDRPRECAKATLVLVKESYQNWKFKTVAVPTNYDNFDNELEPKSKYSVEAGAF